MPESRNSHSQHRRCRHHHHLYVKLRRHTNHCRGLSPQRFPVLSFNPTATSLTPLPRKAKESKICFVGFMGCVDLVLFQKLWDLWVFHVVWFRGLLGFDSLVVLCSL
nr:hypothetical protein CFP56_62560 [Quercus suber]